MRRLASIDVGTNTALLLAAEVSPQLQIHPLVQREKIVRLGEGVDERRLLKAAAMARVMQALAEYLRECRELNVEGVVVSGTSAVRDAANRDDLIHQIKQTFGLELRVLSGEDEARLTYLGALSNKQYLTGEILLIDIGGGSTEFIAGARDRIAAALSIDIGSVRLTERFVRSDPITDEEFSVLENFIEQQIQIIKKNFTPPPQNLVGAAGTVTTLAAMHLQLHEYDAERVDRCTLSFQQVAEIIDVLRRKSLAEKKQLPGLNPARADVILAGAMILWQAMRAFGYAEVAVSDRGLRFGVLLDFAKSQVLPQSHSKH
jgi:exopolyphosphatase/guanosine-5'-triphosphate,3'-diphosphate pyrophosphatase